MYKKSMVSAVVVLLVLSFMVCFIQLSVFASGSYTNVFTEDFNQTSIQDDMRNQLNGWYNGGNKFQIDAVNTDNRNCVRFLANDWWPYAWMGFNLAHSGNAFVGNAFYSFDFKLDDNGPYNTWIKIGSTDYFFGSIIRTDNKLYLVALNTAKNENILYPLDETASSTEWHHATILANTDNNTYRLYFDGKPISLDGIGTDIPLSNSAALGAAGAGNFTGLSMGKIEFVLDYTYPWTGVYLDNLQIGSFTGDITPTLQDVSIDGAVDEMILPGMNLGVNYSYSDADGTTPATKKFDWYVTTDNETWHLAQSSSNDIFAFPPFYNNEKVLGAKVNIILTDSKNIIVEANVTAAVPVSQNPPPQVSDVTVVVGNDGVFTAQYQYNGEDSEATSIVEWYYADTETGDFSYIGNGRSIKPIYKYANKYIKTVVTPVSIYGGVGNSAESEALRWASFTEIADYVNFFENYSDYSLGETPYYVYRYTNISENSAVVVADPADPLNNVLKLMNNDDSNEAFFTEINLPRHASGGEIVAQLKYRTENHTSGYIKFLDAAGRTLSSIEFGWNWQLNYYSPLTKTWNSISNAYSANTWHTLKVIFDTQAKSYDLFLDDVLLVSNIKFGSADSLATISIQKRAYSGLIAPAYVDDISVTPTTLIFSEPVSVGVYGTLTAGKFTSLYSGSEYKYTAEALDAWGNIIPGYDFILSIENEPLGASITQQGILSLPTGLTNGTTVTVNASLIDNQITGSVDVIFDESIIDCEFDEPIVTIDGEPSDILIPGKTNNVSISANYRKNNAVAYNIVFAVYKGNQLVNISMSNPNQTNGRYEFTATFDIQPDAENYKMKIFGITDKNISPVINSISIYQGSE